MAGAALINGTELAKKIRAEVAADVALLRAGGIIPGLTEIGRAHV